MSSAKEAFADGLLTANWAARTPRMMKMIFNVILTKCEESGWHQQYIQRTNKHAVPPTGQAGLRGNRRRPCEGSDRPLDDRRARGAMLAGPPVLLCPSSRGQLGQSALQSVQKWVVEQIGIRTKNKNNPGGENCTGALYLVPLVRACKVV